MKNRNAKLLLAKPGQRIRITNRQVVRYAPNCIAGYPTEYYGMQKDRSAAQNRWRKSKKYPPFMKCDMCGHDAWHVGGAMYECDEGHTFWVRISA